MRHGAARLTLLQVRGSLQTYATSTPPGEAPGQHATARECLPPGCLQGKTTAACRHSAAVSLSRARARAAASRGAVPCPEGGDLEGRLCKVLSVWQLPFLRVPRTRPSSPASKRFTFPPSHSQNSSSPAKNETRTHQDGFPSRERFCKYVSLVRLPPGLARKAHFPHQRRVTGLQPVLCSDTGRFTSAPQSPNSAPPELEMAGERRLPTPRLPRLPAPTRSRPIAQRLALDPNSVPSSAGAALFEDPL